MIYVFSHDVSFSDELSKVFDKIEIFTEENRLASKIHEHIPEGILFDLRFGIKPLKLIEKIYIEKSSIIVIVLLPSIGVNEEIYSDKEIFWPFEPNEIAVLFADIKKNREMLKSLEIVGRSAELIKAAKTIEKIASSDVNVLITGPSGAGKEVIAKAIHSTSNKAEYPFVASNVAAMAPGIIESELFGHEKGAFTGAMSRRAGIFEQASEGTIFLDEIGEIPLEVQAKLLRILEEKIFTRVGGNIQIEANFRLIAATNKNLLEEVEAKRFREDLYYRLSVVSIELPSLAQRKADISPLATHFLEQRKKELKSDKLTIEPGALKLFHRYEWPGNIRELRNVICSFSVTSKSGRIRAEDFEKYIQEKRPKSKLLPVVTGRTPETAEHQLMIQALMALTNEIRDLKHIILTELENAKIESSVSDTSTSGQYDSIKMEDVERELIVRALNETSGNRKKAAKLLGIGERTLYRKLERYNLR